MEAFNPTTFGRPVHRRVVAFAAEHGLAVVGNSDAHEAASVGTGWTTFPGHTAEDLRAAILERGTGWHGQLPRHRRRSSRPSAGSSASTGATRGPRFSAASAATAPAATWATRAGRGGRRASTKPRSGTAAAGGRAVKIGLVTPYVYPLPGGVNDHVGHLYESLRARGHDVRIITASHGLQRSSRGRRHPDREGLLGAGQRLDGDAHDLAALPLARSRTSSSAERFDLLHFHEPFVPFLTLVALRESRSVNVATFHAYAGYAPGYQLGGRMLGPVAASRLHGRIAVSAAARHFADRYLPGDYKVIPNGVDLRRFAQAVPLARWQDGRPNILFVGPPGAAQGPAAAPQGLPDRPQGGLRLPAPGGRLRARWSARRGAT